MGWWCGGVAGISPPSAAPAWLDACQGTFLGGNLVWMHPRLRCIQPLQFPLPTINSGGEFWLEDPPFPIKPGAAGAASVLAAPSQPSIPLHSSLFLGSLLSPGSAMLPSILHGICSSDGFAFPAHGREARPRSPLCAALPPGARLLGIPGLLRGNTKASSAGANMHLLFLLLQKALVAAASHFSSFYL